MNLSKTQKNHLKRLYDILIEKDADFSDTEECQSIYLTGLPYRTFSNFECEGILKPVISAPDYSPTMLRKYYLTLKGILLIQELFVFN